jgi:hypothetical protein
MFHVKVRDYHVTALCMLQINMFVEYAVPVSDSPVRYTSQQAKQSLVLFSHMMDVPRSPVLCNKSDRRFSWFYSTPPDNIEIKRC